MFATPQTITLTGGALTLTNTAGPLTITGPAAGVTISGNSASQVFIVNASVSASMSGLTLTAGSATAAGTAGWGGAVQNSGILSMTSCTISGSSCSSGRGDGLANLSGGTATLTNSTFVNNTGGYQGGGVENDGSMTVTGCTFTGNSSGSGGGLNAQGSGPLNLANDTFLNNTTTGSGGGVAANGVVNMTNCSFSGNTALSGGGAILEYSRYHDSDQLHHQRQPRAWFVRRRLFCTFRQPQSQGLHRIRQHRERGRRHRTYGNGTLTIVNSIVSANTATTKMRTTLTARSTPITATTCSARHSQRATSGTGDIFSDTPMLGALGSNGGPTVTMFPQPGSPAINAGSTAFSPGAADQRGFPRMLNGQIDIGAVETGDYLVISTADTGAGSLRDAITTVNAGNAFSIAFDIPTSDPNYNSVAGTWTIAPASPLPGITSKVLIDGTEQRATPARP